VFFNFAETIALQKVKLWPWRLEIVDICHLATIASSWLLTSSKANHHARHKGIRNMLAQCRFGISLGVHHTRLGGGQPKSGVCTREFHWQIALRTRRSRSRPSPRQHRVGGRDCGRIGWDAFKAMGQYAIQKRGCPYRLCDVGGTPCHNLVHVLPSR
jgi:hypothetical protein